MQTIGVAMIVGGMAFLFSGLIFLIPTERKISSSEQSFDESQQQIEYYPATNAQRTLGLTYEGRDQQFGF
jgi:Na+-transporting methylmalonyl-CoA/oxaloacetate decarboxylase gamma subunit